MDRRAAAVPKEYMLKARKADREYASRATRTNTSDSGIDTDDLDLDNGQDPSNPSGPVESKLRELPPPYPLLDLPLARIVKHRLKCIGW